MKGPFVLSSILSLAALEVVAGAPAKEVPWFQWALVGMEVGPTGAQFGYSDTNDTRYCSRFDGREIVRHCIGAHCEYVVIWARDGDYAYYDSKLLPKAPGLSARDPLRDAVEEGHRNKLPVMAYCVVQQGGHYLEAHPEFEMRDAKGNCIGRFCYNSGYLEVMKQIVAEQLAYGIDGFHIDMIDQGFGAPYGCWCANCQTQFQKHYGKALPEGVTWDEDWKHMLEFRYLSSQRFERALYAHIKSLKPAATVDFNYHGNPPFSWEVGQCPVQHADNSDFVTGETGIWGFSALTVGLNAQFYRAATPGKPYQVAISRDARMYHNQTVRPLADLRWELSTLLAHGAFVTVVDKTAFDGALDPMAYDRIGQAFEDARKRRKHFGHQPVFEVGLYFSRSTRDWYARERPADYFQSFQGAHKALVYEHIPWGVVLDENVTLQTLKQFPIVMLPNVAILSERELELLRSYVSDGGNLIVTGVSGCYDASGKVANKSYLESLVGARFVSKLESLDNWVRFPASQVSGVSGELARDLRLDWPFLVKGPAIICEPLSARPVGELLRPYRTVRQQQGKEGTGWPMSAETAVGPAILMHHSGKGQVLTFTSSPDFATASEHQVVEDRWLIRDAVRFLNPKPRVRVAAPLAVETIVTDEPAERILRIHLVSYSSPAQTTPARERPYVLPALMEEAPIYRVAVELQTPIKSAEAWNKSTSLQRHDRRVEATVRDLHEILSLHY